MTSKDPNSLDSLDCIFYLPESITEPSLISMYEILVHRLRKESQHLPMNTVTQMLIERIAMNYIVIRQKEALSASMGGFAHATAQKEYNNFWHALCQDLQKFLRVSNVNDRDYIMHEVRDILVDVVSEVKDAELRDRILEKCAERIDQALEV